MQAALLTGCRYSELTNLRCADFNTDSDTLTIRQAKAGKPRHVVLTSEGRTLFTGWTAGRPANIHIFLRDDGQPWGRSHQQRPLIEASEIAKISPPVNFHVLRHTHASHLAMKGVGLGVIAAQLGHADTRMTEKHSHTSRRTTSPTRSARISRPRHCWRQHCYIDQPRQQMSLPSTRDLHRRETGKTSGRAFQNRCRFPPIHEPDPEKQREAIGRLALDRAARDRRRY